MRGVFTLIPYEKNGTTVLLKNRKRVVVVGRSLNRAYRRSKSLFLCITPPTYVQETCVFTYDCLVGTNAQRKAQHNSELTTNRPASSINGHYAQSSILSA